MKNNKPSVDHAVWVDQLLRRYSRVVAHTSAPKPALIEALNTLRLADAALGKSRLTQLQPNHPLQVAIVGPTQSGKSTLVNILLDSNAASISALAGFTVHAQGYAVDCDASDLQSLDALMSPMHRTPAAQLDANDLDAYVLEPISSGSKACVNHAVVWDTPDFDSIDAGSYTRAVLCTIGLADIVVLMVSKDKYGDKSVWDMLALLHTLQQPLLVCINKLDEQDEAAVLNAFTRRFTEQFNDLQPPIVLLPFVRRVDPDNRVNPPAARLSQLHAALNSAQLNVDRELQKKAAEAFIYLHREHWMAPLITELQAQAEWSSMINNTINDAEQRYVDGYLNDPDKYDTFNRALAELLTLLEIPGLAPTLARTRQLVTWPARKLLGVGRTLVGRQFNVHRHGSASDSPPDQEADTLQGILNNALIKLQSELLDQPQQEFWMSMNQSLRQREANIRESYIQASVEARREFEPHIEAAAKRLYEQLQSQPTLLNTLRATRVTADAAGIALALKSGGLAPSDLLLAPAMFSVTTLLTESALGRYLDSIKRELKEQQRKHIKERLLQGVLEMELHSLSMTLSNNRLFSQTLEPALMDALALTANT